MVQVKAQTPCTAKQLNFGCLQCMTLSSVCTSCSTSAGKYLYSDNCYTIGEMYSRMYINNTQITKVGLNTLRTEFVACVQVGCAYCLEDSTVCDTVIKPTNPCTTPGQVYKPLVGCVANTGFPANTGIVPSTNWRDYCYSRECNNCSQKTNYCITCKMVYLTHYYPKMYGDSLTTANSYCEKLDNTVLGGGIGLEVSSNTLRRCEDRACSYCLQNTRVCQVCNDRFFLSLAGKCVYYYSQTTPLTLTRNFNAMSEVSSVTTPCTVQNCMLCIETGTRCLQCQTTQAGFSIDYYVSQTSQCTVTPPDGKGKFFYDAGQVTNCLDPNCNNCMPYNSCQLCKTNFYLYNNRCYDVNSPTSFPYATGPDASTASTVPSLKGCNDSSVPNCPRCTINYTICEIGLSNSTMCTDNYCQSCDSSNIVCFSCKMVGGQQYYWSFSSRICIPPSSFSNSEGIVTGKLYTTACVNPVCTNCKTDNTQCTACPSGYTVFNHECVSLLDIPAGYQDPSLTSATTFSPCSTANCQNCKLLNGFCYDSCTTADCGKCESNINTCEACSNYGRYLWNAICILPSEFPSGVGANTFMNSASSCLNPACSNCLTNYQACSSCHHVNGIQYYYFNGTCISIANGALEGYGLDPTTNSYLPCKDPNCSSCVGNFNLCDSCKEDYKIYKSNADGQAYPFSQCLLDLSKMALTESTPEFRKDTTIFFVPFPGKTITASMLEYIDASVRTSDKFFSGRDIIPLTVSPPNSRGGFLVTLKLPEHVNNADIVLERRSTPLARRVLALSSTEELALDSLGLPLRIDGSSTYRTPSHNIMDCLKVLSIVALIIRVITNIALPGFSFVGTFSIDRWYSYLVLVSLQASDKFIYTRMGSKYIFDERISPLLQFDYLQNQRADPACFPTANMIEAGIDCNFMVNYGSNTYGLLIILAIMMLVDMVWFFVVSPKLSPLELAVSSNKSSFSQRISLFCFLAVKAFGLRFFLGKTEGVSLEVVIFAFANIRTSANSGTLITGLVIGFAYLAYYSIHFIFLLKAACGYLKAIRVDTRDQSRFRDRDLVDVYPSLGNYFYKCYSIFFLGTKASLGVSAIHFIFASFARAMVLGMITGLLSSSSAVMPILIILVETCFLGYSYWKTRLCPRVYSAENFLEFSIPVFNWIFCLFSAISTAPGANRSEGLDLWMLILLLAFSFIYFFAVLYIIYLALLGFVESFLVYMPNYLTELTSQTPEIESNAAKPELEVSTEMTPAIGQGKPILNLKKDSGNGRSLYNTYSTQNNSSPDSKRPREFLHQDLSTSKSAKNINVSDSHLGLIKEVDEPVFSSRHTEQKQASWSRSDNPLPTQQKTELAIYFSEVVPTVPEVVTVPAIFDSISNIYQ